MTLADLTRARRRGFYQPWLRAAYPLTTMPIGGFALRVSFVLSHITVLSAAKRRAAC